MCKLYEATPEHRALAAIAAMREPTEAMLKTGERELTDTGLRPKRAAELVFQAMIDVALGTAN